MAAAKAQFDRVFNELKHIGLLLEQDPIFPSVVNLITGGPLRGSWWAHPHSHLIYDVVGQLGSHPDVLAIKLLSKKVTFVHRNLWPAIYAIGVAREDWQLSGLSPLAKSLLKKVGKDGELQTDILVAVGGYQSKPLSKAVSELEGRLLIYCRQFHTERGRHARRLETWPRWAKRTGFKVKKTERVQAKAELQRIIEKQNLQKKAKLKLPWL